MKAGGFCSIQLNYIQRGLFVTPLNRAGRLTGRQINNIHKVQPLRRHQCLNRTFYGCQRNLRRGKKTHKKKQKKINSGGKNKLPMDLFASRQHKTLQAFQFNHADEPARVQDPAGDDVHVRWPKGRRKERVSYSKTKAAWKGAAACRVNGQKRGTEWGRNQKEKHACAHRTQVAHTWVLQADKRTKKQPRARGEAEWTHLSEHRLLGRANSYDTAPLFICVYLIFTAMSSSPSILPKKNAR